MAENRCGVEITYEIRLPVERKGRFEGQKHEGAGSIWNAETCDEESERIVCGLKGGIIDAPTATGIHKSPYLERNVRIEMLEKKC